MRTRASPSRGGSPRSSVRRQASRASSRRPPCWWIEAIAARVAASSARKKGIVGPIADDPLPDPQGPLVGPEGILRATLAAEAFALTHQVPGLLYRGLRRRDLDGRPGLGDPGRRWLVGPPGEADRGQPGPQPVEVPEGEPLLNPRDRQAAAVRAEGQAINRAVERREREPFLERPGVAYDHPPVIAAGREQGTVAGQGDPADLADVGLRLLAGGVEAAEIQRQQVAAGPADHREAVAGGDGELRHPPLEVAAADRRGRFQVVDGDQAAPRPDE